MEDGISHRLNAMEVNSIETFLNLRGGGSGSVREVYFVRALGEISGLDAKLTAIDRKMELEMARSRGLYLRWSELPRLSSGEDIRFYRESVQSLARGDGIALRTPVTDPALRRALDQAVRQTAERYRTLRVGVTDTMLQNFAVKLLYWTDSALRDVLLRWRELLWVKILADNVRKEQEYLFYYLVVQLGCDVLLLNNQGDIEGGGDLKALSQAFRLGRFGTSTLPRYEPSASPPGAAAAPPPERRKLTIPPRPERGSAKARPAPQTCPWTVRPPQGHVRTGSGPAVGRTEKSFEELAALASSIVMIAVLDLRGEPVATGSGIMIGRGGFILTNHHVIREGRFYAVRIEEDERTYTTDEVIKYNSQLDMAVLRIQRELAPLPLYGGGRKLVRGQRVVAIGSPLGLFNSVSDGIISGFRSINGVDMIQFTAPISHGSSGGAVLNMYGEIIGISTAGIDSGQNLNLAVGYEDIRWFAKGFY